MARFVDPDNVSGAIYPTNERLCSENNTNPNIIVHTELGVSSDVDALLIYSLQCYPQLINRRCVSASAVGIRWVDGESGDELEFSKKLAAHYFVVVSDKIAQV